MSIELGDSKPSFRQRLHYKIDNYLARGTSSLFLILLVVFVSSFLIIGLLRLLMFWVFPLLIPEADIDPAMVKDPVAVKDSVSVYDHLWTVYLELTAASNVNKESGGKHYFKIPGIMAQLTGVVIFSTLIATLTTALNQTIRNFKSGHSRVLEKDHTLIIGWTNRVPEILRELVEANESEEDPCVVILSEKEKEWMDEYLRRNFRDSQNLRVVTRKGPTASPAALIHVGVRTCKSVVVLATCEENASNEEQLSSDATCIKTLLAIESAAPDADFPIVIEVFHPRNREVIASVAPGRAFMVDAEEILAKVMVQTSRTSGLSVVYSEILSFEGCEMYFYNAEWNGITFGKCQFHFPDGVPIGVRDEEGVVTIRPPVDYQLKPTDEILIVAEDDSTIDFRNQPVAMPKEIELKHWRLAPTKERMLMLGWSSKAHIIISEYADYVAEGSSVTIVLNNPPKPIVEEVMAVIEGVGGIEIELVHANAFSRTELSTLKPFDYNDIMILPQKLGPDRDAEKIDTETIVLLLLLRGLKNDLQKAGQKNNTKIVTEVLESRNHGLIHQAGVNDFIISNRMVSMIFAQMSEEPGIKLVYDDLFEEDGSEIYVKPVELYFENLPVKVSFADLMLLAQKRDEEACIGVKIGKLRNNANENYGVKLIPTKTDMIELGAGDSLVVVAEDER